MDVAGSVVGVVSLGIVLCDGILQFCQGWKHQDDDVRTLKGLADGLKSVLQGAEIWFQQQSELDPTILSSINNSLQACNEQISRAVSISDKYTRGNPSTKKGKMKELLMRLKFPFERKVVGELTDLVVAFRGNVDLAVSLLNVDLTVSGLEAIRELRVNNMNEQQDVIGAISLQVGDARRLIQESIHESSLDIAAQSTQLVTMAREHKSQLEVLGANQAAMLNLLHQIQNQDLVRTGPFPSLDITILGPPEERKISYDSFGHALITSSQCLCGVKYGKERPESVPWWALGQGTHARFSVSRESKAFVIHDQHCPMWYQSREDTKYRFHSRIFGWQISGSMDVRRSPHAMFSGWKISPNLSFRPVVPDNAPSFKVMERYMGYNIHGTESDRIANCLRDLRIVFQSGQGSPWDVTPGGTNLWSLAFFQSTFNDFAGAFRIAKEFERMGVDVGETIPLEIPMFAFMSWVHSTDVANMLRLQKQSMDILVWFSQRADHFGPYMLYHPWRGAYPGDAPLRVITTVIDALRAYEDIATAADCGALSKAVLRRDLPALEEIVQQRPYLLEQEYNIWGQSPILLAVGWPIGLDVLLKAASGFAIVDKFGHQTSTTPLDYAISLGCTRSMDLLLRRGYAFSFRWSIYVGSAHLKPAVSDLILRLIMERCHQIHDFALRIIPNEVIKSRQLNDFEMFFCQARFLFQYFKSHTLPVPTRLRVPRPDGSWNYFCPPFGSVFHQSHLYPMAAESLFQAGFKNVDLEYEGLTPLMCLAPVDHWFDFRPAHYYGLVNFLVKRGASLGKEIPLRYIGSHSTLSGSKYNYRAIHRVAALSWHGMSLLRILNEHDWPQFSEILRKDDPDPCICACSLDGCQPITLALKNSDLWAHLSHTKAFSCKELSSREEYSASIRLQLAVALEDFKDPCLSSLVLRFLTFSALGLTHTCCTHNTRFAHDLWQHSTLEATPDFESPDSRIPKMIKLMPLAEVEEIREEEAPLIERLETLVSQSLEEMEGLQMPLSTYLRDRWPDRMNAELLAKDEMPESQRRAVAELGVEVFDDDVEQDEESLAEQEKKRIDEYEEWIQGLARTIK